MQTKKIKEDKRQQTNENIINEQIILLNSIKNVYIHKPQPQENHSIMAMQNR